MAQDFESNGARVTNSATTIYTSNSDDAIVVAEFVTLAPFDSKSCAILSPIYC